MQSAFDAKNYRRALGQFPTGVTVITAVLDSGEPIGVTASSFNSVSMDPPLILWSVAKDAYSAAAFRDGNCFVVNVLGKQQVDLSNKFARQGDDKFAGVDYRKGVGGCPIIEDTAGYFECRTWNTYDGGDHLIIVGEVGDFYSSESVMPLVFARGSYSVATPQPVTGNDRGFEFSEGGFLSSYMLYLLNQAHALYSAELYPLILSECGVSPEEWRILTLLADTDSTKVPNLARLAAQPEEDCRTCLWRLVDRGYVMIDSDGIVRINSNGSNLAAKLFAVARAHEQAILQTLSKEQQEHLAPGLARMIAAFDAATVAKLQEGRAQ